MKSILTLLLLMGILIVPVMAEEQYTVTFIGYDDGNIKIVYQDAGATSKQAFTIPPSNAYNKMIVEYLQKFKKFN